jgi:hypothetical protein
MPILVNKTDRDSRHSTEWHAGRWRELCPVKVHAIAALVLLCSFAARGNTITATSCQPQDVQNAINSSSNGDTVLVPSGTCTWNPSSSGNYVGTVNISANHQITLNGQGLVTINFASDDTDPGYGNTVLSLTAGSAANTVIKGFTFNGSYANGRSPITITSTSGNLPFRFTGNTVNSLTGSRQATAINIFGCGNTPGLIDYNTFRTTHNFEEMIHNFGCSSQALDWSSDVTPGGPNMIYIETNTFNGPSAASVGTQAVENFNGARVVFRNNNLTNVDFDAHGDTSGLVTPCAQVNTRWYEVYNNTWTLTTGTDIPTINLRGGSGVIWGNTHSGGSAKIQLQADCISTSSGVPYPYQDQDGRGITTSNGSSTTFSSPIYIWNNTNLPVGTLNRDLSSTSYFALNRDYFVSTSQPATTRCESAADVTAGCPVSYTYTPYTYPYPFGGPASSSTSPAAPRGLTLVVQ